MKIEIEESYRVKVIETLIKEAEASGNIAKFCRIHNLGKDGSIIHQLKKDGNDQKLSDERILRLGQELGVNIKNTEWKTAETEIFLNIKSEIIEAKNNALHLLRIDPSGVGKTHTAKEMKKELSNYVYLDCKHYRTESQFLKAIARQMGIIETRTYLCSERIKNTLNAMVKPIIVLDDFGYTTDKCIEALNSILDATDEACAIYIIGDDTLYKKILDGAGKQKVGFRAFFSRFNNRYLSDFYKDENGNISSPEYKRDKYMNTLKDVAIVNLGKEFPVKQINTLVNAALTTDASEIMGDIRCLKSAISSMRKGA